MTNTSKKFKNTAVAITTGLLAATMSACAFGNKPTPTASPASSSAPGALATPGASATPTAKPEASASPSAAPSEKQREAVKRQRICVRLQDVQHIGAQGICAC